MNSILLSKDIYSIKSIQAASAAFSDICCVNTTENDTHVVCQFTMIAPYPLEITMKEFENYLIDLIVGGGPYANP